MNREDFNILKSNIIYFDNGATTLKPTCIANTISDYYNNYSTNAHRGDYKLSLKVDSKYEEARNLVKDYINASRKEEIIFTSGCTDSLNKIIFGYFEGHLNKGDEVIISKSEHASNILPWFELSDKIGIVIKYVDLDDNYKVTINNLKKKITDRTKVISLAYITNVVGDVRPVKDITKLAHDNNILVVIDGAQSIGHIKTDVIKDDIDFLAFSAHKMCGPTGVGVIYGKYDLLTNMYPTTFGGGMNSIFSGDTKRKYLDVPYNFEAGTQNIAGVIGFGRAIQYINKIGLDNIENEEIMLRRYLYNKLKYNENIIIYNPESESAILDINYKNIFAQDLAIYLDKYDICVRAGNHCAKLFKELSGIKNTVRISLYFYNTKEEIDRLVEVLNNSNIINEII